MDKITCNMCQDLLTLYVDDLCSEDSQKAVEEHLNDCQNCKEAYLAMKQNYEIKSLDETDKLQSDKFKGNLESTWENFKKKSFIKIVSICLIIIALISIGAHMLFFKQYIVDSKDLEIRNVCQLSDGRIAYQLVSKDGSGWNICRTEPIGNEIYTIAKSTLLDRSDMPYWYYAIDINYYEEDYKVDFKAIYYGTPDDRVLIWEEGMDLPKATEEIEAKYKIE